VHQYTYRPSGPTFGKMAPNVVSRDQVREGIVECPLCERQLARPTTHLLVYGSSDEPSIEDADAIECPVCDGVTFIIDNSGRGDETA